MFLLIISLQSSMVFCGFMVKVSSTNRKYLRPYLPASISISPAMFAAERERHFVLHTLETVQKLQLNGQPRLATIYAGFRPFKNLSVFANLSKSGSLG